MDQGNHQRLEWLRRYGIEDFQDWYDGWRKFDSMQRLDFDKQFNRLQCSRQRRLQLSQQLAGNDFARMRSHGLARKASKNDTGYVLSRIIPCDGTG